MGLKNYIKEYTNSLSNSNLVDITCILADVIDNNIDHIDKLKRKIYCIISNGHYNEEYAIEDVKKMYYIDAEGKKHYGPYWSIDDIKNIYASLKGEYVKILDIYNVYDFYVTINMIKSDNYSLYKIRFKNYSEEELNKLFIEDSINWLDDEDNPYGKSKIWKYLNNE